MIKSWHKKFKTRVDKALKRLKRKDHDNDFDEQPLQYKLVNLTLINLGGKGKKQIKTPPVHGNALYYVVDYSDEVTILHPVLLQLYKVGRRTFDKGVTDVWWPNDDAAIDPNAKNRWGLFCNRFNVANRLQERLENYAKRGKVNKKEQQIIREAIADLKQISVDEVPKYKLPEKVVDALAKWRENMRNIGYIKRLDVDLKRLEKEDINQMSDKKKKKKSSGSSSASSSAKSSASSSAASSSADTKKKSKKGAKKETKKKGEIIVRGKKNAKAIALRFLLKNKGKKLSVEKICKEIQKVKGRKKEFPPKMILSKVKQMKAFAEKNGLSFKHSNTSMQLK
jgi:hypothetical protein